MLHICKATRDKALQRYISLSVPYEGVMIDVQKYIICHSQRMNLRPIEGQQPPHGRILATLDLFMIQKLNIPLRSTSAKRGGPGFYRPRRSFAS